MNGDDAVVQIGTLVLVKSAGQIFVRTLTQGQFLDLEKRPDLANNPAGMLDWLNAGARIDPDEDAPCQLPPSPPPLPGLHLPAMPD